MTSAFSRPMRWYWSDRWPAARRTSPARSGWLEILGMRRNASSSLRLCSRVVSRNSSGVATAGYVRQPTTFPPHLGRAGGVLLVDETEKVEAGGGLERPVVDASPAAVVHLRHRERTVGVHRLDIRHVSNRR